MIRIISLLLLLPLIGFAFLYVSDSSEVSIDDKGKILTVTENIRSVIQGKRYWEKQLELVDHKIGAIQKTAETLDRANRTLYDLEKKVDEMAVSRDGQKIPQDPRVLEARRLQREARQLEREISDEQTKESIAKRLPQLTVLREIINERLKSYR